MIGSTKSIINEINCQIALHEKIVSRKTTKIGRINSADERPNQIPLRARPLLLLKYLDIVVDDVWDINPCPENLMRKIAMIKK